MMESHFFTCALLIASLLLSSCEKAENRESAPERSSERSEPRRFYVVSSPHSKRKYTTWEYELLPAGGVRFVPTDGGGKSIVLSQPYEIEEHSAGKGW